MPSLRVLLPGGDLDALTGIGGAPEGVITACAARLLGGDMQGRLAPQSSHERTVLEATGASFGPEGLGTVLGLGDLVAGGDCVFVATAVTGGTLLSDTWSARRAWRLPADLLGRRGDDGR